MTPKGETATVDEPKSARLEVRTQPTIKEAINRAAALKGVDISAFVVNAAYEAAKSTISAHEVTRLESEADRAAFFAALDNPPNPTRRMESAFALRKKLILNAE